MQREGSPWQGLGTVVLTSLPGWSRALAWQ